MRYANKMFLIEKMVYLVLDDKSVSDNFSKFNSKNLAIKLLN